MLRSMNRQAEVPRFAKLRWIVLVALIGLFHSTAVLHGQDDFGADLFPNFSLGGLGEENDDEPVAWSSRYFADPTGRGRLEVQATLASSWHIYSTTQKSGGPTRTKIAITAPADVKATGAFTPDHEPSRSVSSIYDGLTVEEHEGVVVWSAPLDVPFGFEDSITVEVNGLICKSGGDNRCMPVSDELTAEYAGLVGTSTAFAGAAQTEETVVTAGGDGTMFRDGDYVVQWSATVARAADGHRQFGCAAIHGKARPDVPCLQVRDRRLRFIDEFRRHGKGWLASRRARC